VEVLWNPDRLIPHRLEAVRGVIPRLVAGGLTREDPAHIVTPAMVDVRFTQIGPLDLVRSDVFVTVLARREVERQHSAADLASEWAAAVAAASGVSDAVVELVLTDHTSSFDYGSLE